MGSVDGQERGITPVLFCYEWHMCVHAKWRAGDIGRVRFCYTANDRKTLRHCAGIGNEQTVNYLVSQCDRKKKEKIHMFPVTWKKMVGSVGRSFFFWKKKKKVRVSNFRKKDHSRSGDRKHRYFFIGPNESTGTHPKTWPKMQASTLIRVILQGSTLSKLCILVGQDLIGNPKMYIFSI